MIEEMCDEFVSIIDFPNYKINRNGIILNPYKKELKTHIRSDKNSRYYCVHLHKDGKQTTLSLHRLLALHFIPNPENKPTVDHIDRNKLNNDLSNLRWATTKENRNNCDNIRSEEYWKQYKTEKQREYRASMTEEEKQQHLEHRRELYAEKEQTDEQKEAAKERSKKQREEIKADPEKLAQQREYKRLKAQEYRAKKKAEQTV
jgi:hypothetical protein